MKKMISLVLAALLLVSVAVAAELNIDGAKLTAQAVIPEGAVFLGSEYDDGALELKYWSESTQEMYEVTFDAAGGIAKIDSDSWNDAGSATVALTEDEAAQKATELYEGAAVETVILSTDDGLYEYDVYFATEAFYGVITINPETGAITEREVYYGAKPESPAPTKTPDSPSTPVSGGTPSGSGAITAEEAKALVLARLTNGKIVEFETDTDDGRKEYEGEARDDTYEYDFTIDAATGRFLKWERERLSSKKTAAPTESTGSTGGSGNLIGTSRAKSIAKEKAGGGTVTSIKLDYEDGKAVYEGKVVTSSYEYEFEIDAVTGAVRDWDRERIERDDRDEDDDDDRDDDRDDDDDDDDDDD